MQSYIVWHAQSVCMFTKKYGYHYKLPVFAYSLSCLDAHIVAQVDIYLDLLGLANYYTTCIVSFQ